MLQRKPPTIGHKSLELSQKTPDTRDPIELEQEMHKNYEDEVWKCVDVNKKKFEGDFFVVVITKKEKLMQNVLRNYFFARFSCPTPDYDQTLYRYDSKADELEFIWVLPARDVCRMFLAHQNEIVPQERWLLEYVKRFKSGELMKKCKRLNKEAFSSPHLLEK